jgi:hypothetical protein
MEAKRDALLRQIEQEEKSITDGNMILLSHDLGSANFTTKFLILIFISLHPLFWWRSHVDYDPPSAPEPEVVAADDQEQKRLQDILMAYRLTGVTLFNGDEFDQQDWSQYGVDDILEGPKDAGIRFDTFALGNYCDIL